MMGRRRVNPDYALHAMIPRLAILIIGSLAILAVVACGGDQAFQDDFPAP